MYITSVLNQDDITAVIFVTSKAAYSSITVLSVRFVFSGSGVCTCMFPAVYAASYGVLFLHAVIFLSPHLLDARAF